MKLLSERVVLSRSVAAWLRLSFDPPMGYPIRYCVLCAFGYNCLKSRNYKIRPTPTEISIISLSGIDAMERVDLGISVFRARSPEVLLVGGDRKRSENQYMFGSSRCRSMSGANVAAFRDYDRCLRETSLHELICVAADTELGTHLKSLIISS